MDTVSLDSFRSLATAGRAGISRVHISIGSDGGTAHTGPVCGGRTKAAQSHELGLRSFRDALTNARGKEGSELFDRLFGDRLKSDANQKDRVLRVKDIRRALKEISAMDRHAVETRFRETAIGSESRNTAMMRAFREVLKERFGEGNGTFVFAKHLGDRALAGKTLRRKDIDRVMRSATEWSVKNIQTEVKKQMDHVAIQAWTKRLPPEATRQLARSIRRQALNMAVNFTRNDKPTNEGGRLAFDSLEDAVCALLRRGLAETLEKHDISTAGLAHSIPISDGLLKGSDETGRMFKRHVPKETLPNGRTVETYEDLSKRKLPPLEPPQADKNINFH